MSTILLENCIHWNSTKILFKYRFSNMNVNLYQVALQRSWTSFFTFLYFTISKIHWFRSKFVRDIHVYDNCMLLCIKCNECHFLSTSWHRYNVFSFKCSLLFATLSHGYVNTSVGCFLFFQTMLTRNTIAS